MTTIHIPPFKPYSGTKPDSAAGGTRHHPARTQLPLPPEPSRSVPSAPREGSSGEVMIWVGIVVLMVVGWILGGLS